MGEISWWPSLHDADLESFTSSLTDRTATLDVRLDHLGDESGKGSSFRIVFNVVRAINMATWQPWSRPGRDVSDPELMGRRDWGRMVSIELRSFEGPSLRINDANLLESAAGDLHWLTVNCESTRLLKVLTLDIDGTGSDIVGTAVLAVAFEKIDIFRDGQPITAEEFVGLGESYWERWSARNRAR